MIKYCVTALFIALPCAVLADTPLQRLEAASESIGLEMAKVMVREIERKGGDSSGLMDALPDTEWDAEYREAGSCMLSKYEALTGEAGLDSMLSKMEQMIGTLKTATMESIEEMDMLPDGVTQEQSIQISQDCGVIELSIRRMSESGFSDAMMKAYSTIPNDN